MTDNEAYRATLERMERDLEKAETVADKLRAGIAAVRDILSADAIAPAANAARHTPATPALTPAKVSGLTMKQAAIAVLGKNGGKPMKVRDIYETLMKMGYNVDKYGENYESFRGSMTPTLDRDSRAFLKVSPGHYALNTSADAQQAQSTGSTLGLL